MAMGNHDFDRGGLPNLTAQLAAHAPTLDILCANVRTAAEGGQVEIFRDYVVYEAAGATVKSPQSATSCHSVRASRSSPTNSSITGLY